MQSFSIHPRNYFPNGKKKNTSEAPKDQQKGYLGKMLAKYDRRQTAYNATIASIRPEQASAFRRPGSRRIDKI